MGIKNRMSHRFEDLTKLSLKPLKMIIWSITFYFIILSTTVSVVTALQINKTDVVFNDVNLAAQLEIKDDLAKLPTSMFNNIGTAQFDKAVLNGYRGKMYYNNNGDATTRKLLIGNADSYFDNYDPTNRSDFRHLLLHELGHNDFYEKSDIDTILYYSKARLDPKYLLLSNYQIEESYAVNFNATNYPIYFEPHTSQLIPSPEPFDISKWSPLYWIDALGKFLNNIGGN